MLLPSINPRMLPTALGRRFFLHNFQFSDRYKCSFTDCCTPPRLCQRLLRASTRSHWTRANLSPMRWPCSRITSASTSPSTPSTPASWRTRWDTRSGRRKAAPSSPISFSWRTFSLESIISLLYTSWRWHWCPLPRFMKGTWTQMFLSEIIVKRQHNTIRCVAIHWIYLGLDACQVLTICRVAALIKRSLQPQKVKDLSLSKCMIFWFRCTFLLVTQRRCCPSG